MIDTEKNINETIEELHEMFKEIDRDSDEYKNLDLSYLDD